MVIFSPPLEEVPVTYQHLATASDLTFFDFFAPTKNSFFEVSDDVIACNLWFGPSLNQKSWLRLCIKARAWYGMKRKFRYGICQNGMKWKISRMEWKTIFHTSIPIPY